MANSIATGVLNKSLEVYLYMYNGRDNVANKIFKTQAALDENGNNIGPLNITPYGEINSQGFQFIADQLYRCNYCKYQFGGLTYYAYVKVDTYTNGAYIYTTTVDPLTTAYSAGCLNSEQYCIRSPRGRNTGPILGDVTRQLELDPLCRQLAESEIVRRDFVANYKDMYIVMVTSQPTVSVGVAATGTYVMTPEAYVNFLDAFARYGTPSADDPETIIISAELQEKAINSIIRIYAIPQVDVDTSRLNVTEDVLLTVIEDTVLGLNVAARSLIITVRTGIVWTIGNFGSKYGTTNTVNVGLSSLTPAQYIGKGEIVIPDLGVLEFTPQMLGITNIDTVGYSTYVDFEGGTRIAYLNVNGIEYKEVSTSAPYPVMIPMSAYAYNYSNLIPQLSSMSSSMTGSSSEALSPTTVPSGYTLNGVQGGASGASGASGAVAAGGVALAGVTGAIALASTIINNQASYKITGRTGGTTILTSQAKSLFKFIYFPQWGVEDTQLYFGKPTYQIINLQSSSDMNRGYGYFQTSGCSLPSNGLPRDIIAAANAIIDSGAYLGQVNMPD